MKKITIQLTTDALLSLSHFLDEHLDLVPEMTAAEKCVKATLIVWNLKKLKPATFIYSNKKQRLRMDATVAFAFQSLVERIPLDPSVYLDNTILQISGGIDQAFQ